MAESNPFAPPVTAVDLPQPKEFSGRLAGRTTRLLAVIIDGFIALLYFLPILVSLGVIEKTKRQEDILFESLVAQLIALLIFILLHGYFLAANGQTVGKKIMGIRVVDMEGRNPGLRRIVLLRILPVSFISMVPIVGGLFSLIDVLPIFKADRRCVHDLFAGTQVVNV